MFGKLRITERQGTIGNWHVRVHLHAKNNRWSLHRWPWGKAYQHDINVEVWTDHGWKPIREHVNWVYLPEKEAGVVLAGTCL